MSDSPNLISLPLDILYHLSYYLSPGDLLALSATCYHLRSVLNNDWFWQKYTHGGHVSEALDGTPSLVEPVFINPQTVDSMEPLCQNRLHFLKQSRLLSNLREGKYISHEMVFDGFMSDFETSNFICGQQKTYKGIYLFTLDYLNFTSTEEVIKVFNIEREPCLISTLKLIAHEEEYAVVIGYEIVGDKLLVRKDNWFDVYQIEVPFEALHILHSINTNINTRLIPIKALIVSDCLFVEKGPSNLHVWDIGSGEKLGIINPTNEQKASVLCYSEDRKYILFYITNLENTNSKQLKFYAYDILFKKYICFIVPSNYFLNIEQKLVGLVDSKYAVLLRQNEPSLKAVDIECSIVVYNYVNSNVVVHHNHIKGFRIDSAKIIKSSYLLLPLAHSVQVMDLLTLDTIWILSYKNGIFDMPDNYIVGLEYINIYNLCEIILVHKVKDKVLWDLEKRIAFLDFQNYHYDICIGINEHCSKMLKSSNGILKVLSYW